MAPRKEKLSWDRYLSLIADYKIEFKGCVPPRNWPNRYKHHFQKIREISLNRFEEYGQEESGDKKFIGEQMERVSKLCRDSDKLRCDINTNESTWRKLENLVFKRFEGNVVWYVHDPLIRGEKLGKAEYQALPLGEIERMELNSKRERRALCTCDGTALQNEGEVHHSDIFQEVREKEVTHHPGDDLRRYKISMKPDRVIGLYMNDKYKSRIGQHPHYIDHCPVSKSQVIHPFLVVEAKQEYTAPGFRGIEVQTAFVIRRFLKSQDDLRKGKNLNLDPLVWFFGFRGDVWRLYAGVLNDDVVHVYDLWMGTVQSEDTALQLFQIVDFISSWARDIYRRQIKRGIQLYERNSRGVSPSTTVPTRRSESVVVEAVSRPLQVDLVSIPEPDLGTREGAPDFFPSLVDGTGHRFHRLTRPDTHFPGISQTVFRHSNIVKFSFRIMEIPNDESILFKLWNHFHHNLLSIMGQNDYTLLLREEQLRDLARCWTGATSEVIEAAQRIESAKVGNIVKAFICFRTCFDPNDWGIRREIYCLIWSAEVTYTLEQLSETPFNHDFGVENLSTAQGSEVNHAFQLLRSITGRESVTYAYKNLSCILLSPSDSDDGESRLSWQLPEGHDISDIIIQQVHELFKTFSSNPQTRHHSIQVSSVQYIRPSNAVLDSLPGRLTTDDYQYGNENGILARKADHWPAGCQRYCLIVLTDQGTEDKGRLWRWLDAVIRKRWLCLDGNLGSVTREDQIILKDWVKHFYVL